MTKLLRCCVCMFGVLCLSGCLQKAPLLDVPQEVLTAVEATLESERPSVKQVIVQDYQTLDDISVVAITFQDPEEDAIPYPNQFCFYVLAEQEDSYEVIYQSGNCYSHEDILTPWGFVLNIIGRSQLLVVDAVCLDSREAQKIRMWDSDGDLLTFSLKENQGILSYVRWGDGSHMKTIEALDREETVLAEAFLMPDPVKYPVPMVEIGANNCE